MMARLQGRGVALSSMALLCYYVEMLFVRFVDLLLALDFVTYIFDVLLFCF